MYCAFRDTMFWKLIFVKYWKWTLIIISLFISYFRQGSSIVVYLVQNGSPVTEEIRAKTGAEILNAVDDGNGALVVNGASYSVQGDPVILLVSDTGDITEGSHSIKISSPNDSVTITVTLMGSTFDLFGSYCDEQDGLHTHFPRNICYGDGDRVAWC